MNADDDDFDNDLYAITLQCADCGHIFRREHQYVCPVCAGRNVKKPSKEAFDKHNEEIGDGT